MLKQKESKTILNILIVIFITILISVISCQLPFFGGGDSGGIIPTPPPPPSGNTPMYKIAYIEINTGLHLINEDGSNKITIDPNGANAITWSPDGTKLLASDGYSIGPGIYRGTLLIYDLTTNQKTTLFDIQGKYFELESDKNLFVTNNKIFNIIGHINQSGFFTIPSIIYEVDITNINNPQLNVKVSPSGQQEGFTDMAVSPDGTKIAYNYRPQNSDSYIKIKDFTTNQEPIIPQTQGNNLNEFDIRFSPTGDKIAFISIDNNNIWKLYLYTISTSQIIELTNGLPNAAYITYDFSPDGTKVVFHHGYPGTRNIYIYDIAQNQRQQILQNIASQKRLHLPRWTNDGSTIFFQGFENNSYFIHKVRVVGGDYVYDGVVVGNEPTTQDDYEVSPIKL